MYLSRGWTTDTWYGNGNTLINNIPSNLAEQDNGSVSYINSGDVITFNNVNDPNGHAAIVNNISGGTVNIINQNADLHSMATITSGALGGKNAHLDMTGWAGYYIQAIVHAPSGSVPSGGGGGEF
jgi:hypothetical protein